jgi:hypothetical protein
VKNIFEKIQKILLTGIGTGDRLLKRLEEGSFKKGSKEGTKYEEAGL